MDQSGRKQAVIIGAGPAGLTAALELLERTDIRPVVFEASTDIGGLSKTVNYKGNRIDIGGHRFFSKSDRVMHWWLRILPLQKLSPEAEGAPVHISYHNQEAAFPAPASGPDPAREDKVMLVRKRLSRIYFLRALFSYPVSLSMGLLTRLGPVRSLRILMSYLQARLNPVRHENTLEDFLINRFGRELYLTFFKDYTEKVWGMPCHRISAEWGAQRIKGLSIQRALSHALRSFLSGKQSIAQKGVETSLIEQFLYPKFGPGQMWEEVARLVSEKGGEVHVGLPVTGIQHENERITAIEVTDSSGHTTSHAGDFFFSTMPVQELIAALKPPAPPEVREVAQGLIYRDFITVGVLLKKFRLKESPEAEVPEKPVKDNWIYIQEKDVQVGRLQIFNNWSPYLVKDPTTTWIGLEYFCNEGDPVWNLSDHDMAQLAISELAQLGMADPTDVLDHTVIRMKKTYPAYFGSYNRFHIIRNYTDHFANLFLIGRNGMHKYNNSDHSMLTAMVAVDNIVAGLTSKENIWAVNTEEDFHEEVKK